MGQERGYISTVGNVRRELFVTGRGTVADCEPGRLREKSPPPKLLFNVRGGKGLPAGFNKAAYIPLSLFGNWICPQMHQLQQHGLHNKQYSE